MNERLSRLQAALRREQLDAVLCALPAYVLLLTGYWPVVGTSIAVVTAKGACAVLAPQDEEDLARTGWADTIETYRPGSLDRLQSIKDAAAPPLGALLKKLGVDCARIGYELGAVSEPSSYSSMHLFQAQILDLLRAAAPASPLAPADELLAALAAVKTQPEVEKIRRACRIAGEAFQIGCQQIAEGRSEPEIAAAFRTPLSVRGIGREGVQRAGGFAWCMSGPNSALAKGAYARSRDRQVRRGDLVLVHCNSQADGYWTDITRTYVVGEPDEKQKRIYAAIFAARAAALAAIKPGAGAADVDRAAREVLALHGFGNDQFPHPSGHGVGFAAISANARPRLHPKSEEVLEEGMVFNLEPAVYLDGYGGARHCDMVAVTEGGAEVLTPFQDDPSDLIIPQRYGRIAV